MKRKINTLLTYSYNKVAEQYRRGQIDGKTFAAFNAVWNWFAPRYSGVAVEKQNNFYFKFGMEAYKNRINKVRAGFDYLPLYKNDSKGI